MTNEIIEAGQPAQQIQSHLDIASTQEMKQRVQIVQHVMKEVMKPEVHYGVISGCK